jgi:hypothetical protein
MRTILCAAVLMLSLPGAAVTAPHWDSDGQTFDVFYSSLSPHGDWITVEGASYAWRPREVARDWRPYWNGHWLWSDQGWYWWSPEPWAWATYHYGRWYFDEEYGWVWIPGYDWAPAWVEWRYGGDYVGWAPLGPYAIYSAPVGIRYNRYWVTPARWWSFVGCGMFTHHELWRHVEPVDLNERHLYGTRTIGSIRHPGGRMVTGGPDRVFIEQRTNVRLENAEIVDAASERDQKIADAGGRARIQVYRPNIDRSASAREERGPANVLHDRQAIRLDPRGMEGFAPTLREGGSRPARPEMHRMGGSTSGRDGQGRTEWRFDRPTSRRLEGERPKQGDTREVKPPRENPQRGNIREGKREEK